MTEQSSTPPNEQLQNHSLAQIRPVLQPRRKLAPQETREQEGTSKEFAPYLGGWRAGQELKAQAKQAASTESMLCSALTEQRPQRTRDIPRRDRETRLNRWTISCGLKTRLSLGLFRRNTRAKYSSRELANPEITGGAAA
jgi:hypothetical protein